MVADRKKKVLLVDDDHECLAVTGAILNDYGCMVYEARDFKEILDLVEEKKVIVDLVILDLVLPVFNGFNITAYLRAHRVYKDVPIIAMTARDYQHDRDKALKLGCNSFINKPYSVNKLLEIVRQLLLRPKSESAYDSSVNL